MQQAWDRLKSLVKPSYISWFLIVIGTILRLRQYFVNRSLWADEASLGLNLVNRTFSGLTQPLDYGQGAPIGFLFIEKFFIITLGNTEYVLRLFPLFSGILALYLVYRIAREYIGTAGMFAILMFVFSPPLIYYASELKQYSSDIMVALLLVLLSGRCFGERVRAEDLLFLGIGGMISIWISHPAAFILAGIGFALALEKATRRNYEHLIWVLGLGILWLVSFGMDYIVSLRHLAGDPYLQSYWRKAFMPVPPWSDQKWIRNAFYSLVSMCLGRTDLIPAISCPILAFLGSLSILKRNRSAALILILPFFMTLFASALQKYPFKDRFVLFLVPFILLLMAEGVGCLYSLVAKWKRLPALVLSGFPAVVLFGLTASGAFQNFSEPISWENIKPVMAYVGENRNQNDIVYVFHGAEPAFKYYAPFYGLETGKIIIGFDTPRKKLALQHFYDDVDELRGNNRVWFIFSAIVDCGGCEGDMQEFYVRHLNSLGTMVDSFNAAGANAYLYDLSP